MQAKSLLLVILFVSILASDGYSQSALLSFESTGIYPEQTGAIHVILDNSEVDEVAAGEMVITFDKDIFTVISVEKTERSSDMDIFLFSTHDDGISFVFVGIGHTIAPGVGAIADIIVNVGPAAGHTSSQWCIMNGSSLVNPPGNEIPHTTECLTITFNKNELIHVDIEPVSFVLFQNYPNPFNPETEISFGLSDMAEVTLSVYNMLGQVVEILVENEQKEAGYYTVSWNAENLSSGFYFCRLRAGEFTGTKRMLLLK